MNRVLYQIGKLITCTGEEPIENCDFFVEDGVISHIGPKGSIKIDEQLEIVDLSKYTVVPGLIDAHTHITFEPTPDTFNYLLNTSTAEFVIKGAANLEKFINAGVTHIRDMISVDYIDMQMRDLVARGLIKGPQMKVMGKVITMTGGTSWKIAYEVDGKLAVRQATRDVLKRGADFVKIYSTGGVLDPLTSPDNTVFFAEELHAAVEVAEAAGKFVATHAHGNKGIRNALTAGIHTIEHGTFLDDWCIETMIKQGTYLVPTLSALHHILIHGLEGGIPKYVVEQAKYVTERQIIGFEKAAKAGVKIATGTDCGCPFNYHGLTYTEAELMVSYGMSNMDALRALTSVGAEALQIEDQYGTLEKGKIADFVVLEKNPLDDINALKDVISVYQKGKKVV